MCGSAQGLGSVHRWASLADGLVLLFDRPLAILVACFPYFLNSAPQADPVGADDRIRSNAYKIQETAVRRSIRGCYTYS